jgi:adenylyl-sulfate kinase
MNLHKFDYNINKELRNSKFGHPSPVIWLTGLSGSGKSTLASLLESYLLDSGYKVYVLDGDSFRSGLNKDLGFSKEDRGENIRRVAEVGKLFSDSGTITITSFISPFSSDRKMAKEIIGEDFIQIWIKCPLETCESRDPKGLYKKARLGQIKDFTGIDSPYEDPQDADLIIDTSQNSIKQSLEIILQYLKDRINYVD